jgi:hypothetical protein
MDVVSVLVLVAGCGGPSPARQPDGGAGPPPIDAMVDASPETMVDAMPDARDPLVRVHVPANVPGRYSAAFYDPANHAIAIVTVGADGIASAMMPDGGLVVVTPDPVTGGAIDNVRALFGVEPGDDIKLVPPEPFNANESLPITVSPQDGTAVYRAGTSCGGGGSRTTDMTLFLISDCKLPQPIIVQAEDSDDVEARVIGAYRSSLTSTSSTVTGTYVPSETVSVQITNSSMDVTAGTVMFPVVEDRLLNELNRGSRPVSIGTDQGATISSTTVPGSMIDARRIQLLFGTSFGSQTYQRMLAPTQTVFAFDGRTDGLPWYQARGYDPVQRKLTVSRAADPAIDGQVAEIDFEGDFFRYHWTLVMPPNATEVVMPVLPWPNVDRDTTHGVIIQATATSIRASSYDGYGDLRRGVPLTSSIGSFYDTTSR